ncbi:hypothetical protein AB4499_03105 [Vibrio cyclitrophicus]
MQNNYVKELAVKTYQEEITRESMKAKVQSFHAPSFFGGVLFSVILVGLF